MLTLIGYCLVVALNTAILIVWARYNQVRFRDKEKRRSAEIVTLEELGERYGVSASTVAEWQKARTLTMHHDQHGHLVDVTSGTEPL